MSEEFEEYRVDSERSCGHDAVQLSETPMKIELKNSASRHAHRLIKKMQEIADVPSVVQDSIRREMEYATLDGYRITMKHQTETETDNEDRFNR